LYRDAINRRSMTKRLKSAKGTRSDCYSFGWDEAVFERLLCKVSAARVQA